MPGGAGGGGVTPSNHILRYDAQRYQQDGFIEVRGRVRELAQKPRYWQVTATAKTQDPATGEQRKHHFKFKRLFFCDSQKAKQDELFGFNPW